MICAQWGVLLHYDDHGVTRRNRRRESWSSLRRIREAKFGPGAVVIFEDGKSLGLSPDNRGLEPFLIAAFEKRVPGIEALVRKPEGPSGPPLA